MSDESDALNDMLEDGMYYDHIERNPFPTRESFSEPFYKNIREAGYLAAKSAKVGSIIKCSVCNKRFIKKSYQQAFCSNKGQSNCKDKYWNYATPKRRAKTKLLLSGAVKPSYL